MASTKELDPFAWFVGLLSQRYTRSLVDWHLATTLYQELCSAGYLLVINCTLVNWLDRVE